jgi:hypothetical protein
VSSFSLLHKVTGAVLLVLGILLATGLRFEEDIVALLRAVSPWYEPIIFYGGWAMAILAGVSLLLGYDLDIKGEKRELKSLELMLLASAVADFLMVLPGFILVAALVVSGLVCALPGQLIWLLVLALAVGLGSVLAGCRLEVYSTIRNLK